jgi:hypothetical protein
MRTSLKLSAIAAAAAFAAPAFAAPAVDGTKDALYGPAVSIQTVQTGFGDSGNPGGGSELNAAYAHIAGGNLYLMLTGNLEGNFNKLNIFIDSVAGGENIITPSTTDGGNNPTNDGWASKHAGMTFDTGFAADYMVILRNGNGSQFDIDFNSVGSAGTVLSAGNVFSGSTQGNNASALPNGIGIGFSNVNIAGVTGGSAAADQAAALAVTTGVELAIPLAALGNPSEIKISAMINGSNHDYLSNQFLGGLPAGQGNLGGDGAGGFNGTVGQINLNNYAGNQFFTVVVPEPAALSLLAMPALALIRRRK